MEEPSLEEDGEGRDLLHQGDRGSSEARKVKVRTIVIKYINLLQCDLEASVLSTLSSVKVFKKGFVNL